MSEFQHMSDEDAKKEADDINAEIAREKGLDPATGKPLADKKAEEEPDETLDEEEDLDGKDKGKRGDKDSEASDDDEEEDEGEEADPADKARKPKTRIPLSKFQDFKKKTRAEKEALLGQLGDRDKLILELQGKLDSTKSDEERDKAIATYAEKHGKSIEEVTELFALLPKPAVDPKLVDDAKTIRGQAQKIEAENKFNTELTEFLDENPEAAEHKDKIRAEAFKDENLSKSLYEIFNRFVKPGLVEKKKTGESSRGAVRSEKSTDIDKIIENLKNNTPNALNGLSDEVLDKVFEKMGESGSRYNR